MPKVIELIAGESKQVLEIVNGEEQTEVVLKLSLPFDSLVEVITKLEIRELIQLKRSLDRQINHALESYTAYIQQVI